MKKFIQFSAAAILVAGLSACGGTSAGTAPGGTPSATATSTHVERAVPDVVGMTYKEAYETLVKDDFFAQLVDKTGAKWITGNPWDDVKVASTDPAAGTMSSADYVNVALEPTQDEYAAQTGTAK